MSITRVGTNKKYATGWDHAFGGKKGKSAAGATDVKNAAAKPAAAKPASKPAASPKKKGAAPKKKAKK